MTQSKRSIVKSTKEGALYLNVGELFEQDDVKSLVLKLADSKLRKLVKANKKQS